MEASLQSWLLLPGLLIQTHLALAVGSVEGLGPSRQSIKYTNASAASTSRGSHATTKASVTSTPSVGTWATVIPWSTWANIIQPTTNGTGPEYASSCNAAHLSYSKAYSSLPYKEQPKPAPTCYIDDNDCIHLKSAQDLSWSMDDVWTVSLANPPNEIVVNGKTTPLNTAGPLTTPPPLTIHGDAYTALPYAYGISYTLSNATNYYSDLMLTPGGQLTATWNGDYRLHDYDLTMPYRSGGPACTWLFSEGPRWVPDHGELSIGQLPTPIKQNLAQARECKAQYPCTITGVSVDLQFFAPPPITRDLNENTSPGWYQGNVSVYSMPHEATVVNSTTYWSDSAYLKYDSIYAVRTCDEGKVLVGTVVTDHVVALPSTEVSSLCGWKTYKPWNVFHTYTIGATPWPFNFYDLQGSVPQSAWDCQPPPIFMNKPYAPKLAVPTEIRSLNPEWESCVMWFQGSFDPPTALGTASIVAILTSEAQAFPSLPATPGVTPPPMLQTTMRSQPAYTPARNPFVPLPDPTPITAIGSALVLPDPMNPDNIVVAIPAPSKFPNAPHLPPGEVFSPGGPSKVIDGTTVSVAPNGNIIIGGPGNDSPKTVQIPGPTEPAADPRLTAIQGKVPVVVVGDKIVYKEPSSPSEVVIVGSDGSATTLTLGSQPVTISGTKVMLSPALTQGMDLVIQAPDAPPAIFTLATKLVPDAGEMSVVEVASLGSTRVTYDISLQIPTSIIFTITTSTGKQQTVDISLPLSASSTVIELKNVGITIMSTPAGVVVINTETGTSTTVSSAVLQMLWLSSFGSNHEVPDSSNLYQQVATDTNTAGPTTRSASGGDGETASRTQDDEAAVTSSSRSHGKATTNICFGGWYPIIVTSIWYLLTA
ncbi:hypothetical protein EJ05DRAFT_503640 [Pseudovirgaria hyperparasitica]|uniref:Ig-like domain-containing protein n=1 Tax=Pseudovirgaria hyperparasitica TaxID=470096 RepID=A0A6A6VXY1_9PEZI|nr:uncharacterized protein EJ05DRAFT_503640 [Pseudovirgaria hyperparasitica]KAF2754689.1 hypothetical protein EJ05DRAFT_503640 [Pseudovirgaria hyperparasitica]